jgi:hypothetical protein
LPERAAVQPVGAEALVGFPGKKKPEVVQPYHTIPIGEVALGESLNDRLYVYGPLPEPLIVPLAISPCARTEVAVPATSIRPRRILPAAVVMPVDRIKLDWDALFMAFLLVSLGLA